MGTLIYLNAPRPSALETAYALQDVEHLLVLCREVELRALSQEQGVAIGRHLDPELIRASNRSSERSVAGPSHGR